MEQLVISIFFYKQKIFFSWQETWLFAFKYTVMTGSRINGFSENSNNGVFVCCSSRIKNYRAPCVWLKIDRWLFQILHLVVKEWRLLSMKAFIDSQERRPAEATWVPGGGIELSSSYFIYATKYTKINLWKN